MFHKTTVIGVGALLALIWMYVMNLDTIRISPDIAYYTSVANMVRHAQLAGTDILSGYPPLASALFFSVYANILSLPFEYAWGFTMLLVVVLCVLYFAGHEIQSGLSWLGISLVIIGSLMSGELLFARFDIFVMILLFLTWRTFERTKYSHSAFFAVTAACLKFVPVFTLPLLLVATPPHKRMSAVAGIVLSLMVAAGLSCLILTPHGAWSNIRYFFDFRSGGPVQIETTWSGLDMVWAGLHGRTAYFGGRENDAAWSNMDIPSGPVHISSVILMLAAIAFLGERIRRKKSAGPTLFMPSYFILILWVLGVSPVLSPQYFLWILPIVLSWLLEKASHEKTLPLLRVLQLSVTIGIAFLTGWIYPYHYQAFLDQTGFLPALMLNLRNLSVFVLIGLLYLDPDCRTGTLIPDAAKAQR